MTGALVVTWGTETRVFDGPFIAGRGGRGGLDIADQYASPMHAKFTPTADGWTVEDLGSTNGTHVAAGIERERVWGPRLLRKGDRVRIGRTVLTVVPA